MDPEQDIIKKYIEGNIEEEPNDETNEYDNTKQITIRLLNSYIDNLEYDIQKYQDKLLSVHEDKYIKKKSYYNSIIEYKENQIRVIKSNIFELCTHNWIDDEYDTIDGLRKFTYCKNCLLVKE
jgi:hypothetical protein